MVYTPHRRAFYGFVFEHHFYTPRFTFYGFVFEYHFYTSHFTFEHRLYTPHRPAVSQRFPIVVMIITYDRTLNKFCFCNCFSVCVIVDIGKGCALTNRIPKRTVVSYTTLLRKLNFNNCRYQSFLYYRTVDNTYINLFIFQKICRILVVYHLKILFR